MGAKWSYRRNKNFTFCNTLIEKKVKVIFCYAVKEGNW